MKTKDYIPSEEELISAILNSACRLQMAYGNTSMYMFISPLMAIELALGGIDFTYNIDLDLSGFSCYAKCLN